MKLLLYPIYTLSSSYYVISTLLISPQSSLGFISPHVSPYTTSNLLLTQQQQQQQQHTIITHKRFQTHLNAMRRQQRSSNKKSSSPNNTKRRTTTTKQSSNNNKKQTKRSKKSSSSSSSTISALEFLSTTTISPKNKPKKSKTTPPWTVMSPNDAKTHAAALKDRRRRLASGETSLPPLAFAGTADTSPSNRLLSPVDRELYDWKPFRPFKKDASRLLYVGSYLDGSLPPRLGVPEVAFLGRSNVGKSSLLNKLVEVCSTESSGGGARVGKTPGATASVNLYALMNRGVATSKKASSSSSSSPTTTTGTASRTASKPLLGLVDLPGFGYAKLSKSRKRSVEDAAERYLAKRKELALGVLLLDARRVPSPDDRAVLDALYDMNVPLCIVATKVDKVDKERELEVGLEEIARVLGLPGPPACVSGVTGEGVRDLWKIIMDACRVRVKELKGEEDDEQEIRTLSRLGDDGDDDDNVSYDQGYEWSRPMTGARDDYLSFDDYDDEFDDDDDVEEEVEDDDAMISEDRLRIKSLKKLARRLERGGEI